MTMSSNTQFANPPPPITLPNMSVPPPTGPNLSAPPPAITTINTAANYQYRYPAHREVNRGFVKPFRSYHTPKLNPNTQEALQDEFDGKRLRKSVMRKTVDYNSSIIKALENRIWQRDYGDRRALQPDVTYYPDLLPPPSYIDNPINAVTTRFVKTATNKMRCPIFCMAWTPEGRRLVTGASSGEFTLWNGLTFNFETILQAHDSPARTMVWSHNESWMVTGDHAGYVKYWQSNMNNVKMFQAHKEAIRGLSFSPTDHKLATCSDDGTVRIWDFLRCHEERILRGHGADVKCVNWHPQKGLIISGSKDNQQPVKLWDPKSGQSLATLHAHKSTVMDLKWNENGNWFVTASRDHLLKLFDLRNLNQEVQTFRGHKKEASSVAWHPSHEGLFCSGGSDGAILFWHVGADKEVGAIEQAHDSIVWTLAWHPLGHILCSGSNDHTSKFWTRNRPGDLMRDKYNLNTLPAGTGGIDDHEIAGEAAAIPGMGPEDRINADNELDEKNGEIPGLDLDHNAEENKKLASKKVPYSKPIPRNFQAQWNEMEAEDLEQVEGIDSIVNQLIETTPGVVPLSEVTPNAIILYGKVISVEAGSKLAEAISKGTEAINKLVQSGEIEDLRDIVGLNEEQKDSEDYLQDDGEINYSKIPDIELPAPLASSKFAQNPELLKPLNHGTKRKFDDSQSSDTDRTYGSNIPERQNPQHSFNESNDEDYRRYPSLNSRMVNAVRSSRIHDEQNVKSNFGDSDFRLIDNSFNDTDTFSEENIDEKLHWDDENSLPKSDSNFSQEHYDSSNYHNMQNSNPNRVPSRPSHVNASQHSSKMNPLSGIDNSLPHSTPHHDMPPTFRPTGPPPPLPAGFNPNFRPPPHNNLSPNMHFRQMPPFSNQGPFNHVSGPPPNFRPSNSNFDRSNFAGSNYRGQTNQQSRGPTNNYNNSNFGNFPNQSGPNNRSGQMNRASGDNNRTNYNNRGRGRDTDQLRGDRYRDNY